MSKPTLRPAVAKAATALVLLGSAINGMAATAPTSIFTISGGTAFSPAANDYQPGVSVTRGSQVNLVSDALLTFTFISREAGFTNQFMFNGTTLFDSAQPIGTSAGALAATAGLINFGFMVPAGASTPSLVTNATNPSMINQASFATRVLSPTSVLLFLDDIGAGSTLMNDDDDYDDMVVRIDGVAVAPIPDLSAWLAMSLGLGTLGWVTRKNKVKSA
jgi:hypothetical protein